MKDTLKVLVVQKHTSKVKRNMYTQNSPFISKTCVKRLLSKRQKKLFFKINYCLMQVKSLPECSKGSILQYFQTSLSYHLSSRPLFCLFLCGGFRQVSDRRETGLSPPVKYFTDLSKAVHLLWIIYVFSVLCLLCLCVRLFICALWSKGQFNENANEYDQEISQSYTADQPMALRGRATEH